MKTITRDEAFALLKKYNKDPFHIQHALTPMNLAMAKMQNTGEL